MSTFGDSDQEPVDLVIIGGPGSGKSEVVAALHGARVRECHDVAEALSLKAAGAAVVLVTRPGVEPPKGIAPHAAIPNASSLGMLRWIALRVAGYVLTGALSPDAGSPPLPPKETP